MAWQDEIIGVVPTYNGVGFTLQSLDFGFGWQLEDYTPTADSTDEDTISSKAASILGAATTKQTKKLPKTFTITASFSGDDYIDARNAFIDEIVKGGTGLLIIPTYEPIYVNPSSGTARYENTTGGYEEINITFREAGEQKQPTTIINTKGAAEDGIDGAKEVLTEAFDTSLDSGAGWVETEAVELTETLSETITDTLGLGAVGEALETVTELATSLAQNASSLIYTPTTLATQINDAISALTLAFEQPLNAFDAQLQLLENYGIINTSTGATQADQDAIDNNNSYVQIVNNIAIAEAGRAAVLATYDSLDDALLVKSRFEAAARAQQLNNGNLEGYEQSYRELAEIIALVSNHIVSQENLPSNVDISYPDSTVSLALAEDLYGDADRAPELVLRNSVRNPLFMPKELSVLSF